MKLEDAIVLITGANRGIGLAFAEAALARGARKVYACARNPSSITTAGAIPVQLDVTSDHNVAAAARLCSDVSLLINNAGIARPGGLLNPEANEAARAQFDTNVFGIVRVTQAFAPILARNGGGAFLNVLSAASWINSGAMTAYAVSKAAAWSLTNGLRNELRQQGTHVLGLHVGFVDTDLARGLDVVKVSPQSVVAAAFDALEAGASEVLADDRARTVKRGLTAEPPIYLLA
jgi:NAD(P)-dependent dehydrogenase (short-subunit alcohol dehydrogenase family)